MINVQPYHDKLDKLQEWINLFIDRQSTIWIDVSSLPEMSAATIFRLWNEYGVSIWSHKSPPLPPPPKFITFKEYCDEAQ